MKKIVFSGLISGLLLVLLAGCGSGSDGTKADVPRVIEVSTVAGAYNTEGYLNGSGSSARFRYPEGITVDSQGNLFVADWSNHVIRKITSEGVVTTFAGTGVSGSLTADPAQFNGISGITIDSSDNLYVADYGNKAIRKITPSGVVSTLFSTGITSPYGIVWASSDHNLYFVDNHSIKRLDVASNYTSNTLIAGVQANPGDYLDNQDGVTARFNGPTGITAIGSYLYVCDLNNHVIRKVSMAAPYHVACFAGDQATAGIDNGTTGLPLTARFAGPNYIAADPSGNLYVTSTPSGVNDYTVREISTGGNVTTVAGSNVAGNVDGTDTIAQFTFPKGIAVRKIATVTYIYVVDQHCIRKITIR